MQLSGEHEEHNFSLCTVCRHNVENRYFNSAKDGDWSASRPGRLARVRAPRTHRLGG